MVTETVASPNPRFGMQAPLDSRVTRMMPSGLASITTATQTAVLDDPGNPATLRFLIDSIQTNGNLFTRSVDWSQRLVTELTPEGRVTSSRFDTLGRVIEFRTPGLATITTTFDSAGRLATATQGGRVMQYRYGANGRLERSIRPLGMERRFAYDSAGRVVSAQGPGGVVAGFAYDGAGRRTGVTLPGGQQYGYSYDSAGHLQSYTAPAVDGQTAVGSYTYDLAGRRTSFTRPDSSVVRFVYDETGRMEAITHADGQVAMAYYPLSGLPKRLSTNGDADAIAFSYDGPLLTSTRVTGLVAGTVGFGYDADLRVTSLTVNGQPLYIQHDRDGLLKQVGGLTLDRAPQTGVLLGTTLLGVSTRAAVDSFGAALADSAWAGEHQLLTYELARDSLRRVIAKHEIVDGVELAFGYTYDDAGRLHEVRRDGVVVVVYEYDANGNRKRKTGPGSIVTGTYDARDRLIAYGDAQYTFGASGELQTKVTGTDSTAYHYDALGNLLSVALPDGRRIEYVVDAMSRRIARKVNGVVVRRFLYGDGPNPQAEVDAAGSVTTRYVYGEYGNVPAYMERGGTTYRLLTDQLGSVRLVVNASSGVIAQRIDYDEFGRVVADSNPGFQPFGYAGGLYDADTRLVRFGARDYDPETGRWTAPDPLGLRGGDENLYAYVSNAPLSASDPTGLEVDCAYSQSTGMLLCVTEDGQVKKFPGNYSGGGKDNIGKNKPDMENVSNVGPIPRGMYTIEDCYTGDTAKYGPKSTEMGQPVLSLIPDEDNNMAGREGGFLIHGDNKKHTASEGCIILPPEVRKWIQKNGGGDLEVVR
jgi:RHS repeat-associated protein